MRILLVTNLHPPYCVGGYERLAGWVAEGLRERGHLVYVLTGRGPALEERAEVLPRLDLDLPALCEAHFRDGIAFGDGLRESFRSHVFSVRNYRACRDAIAAVRPAVVSFWNPAFITFSPLVAARRMGVPAIVHLSDASANPFRNPHAPAVHSGLAGLARWTVDGLLARARARTITVPSEFLAGKYAAQDHLSRDRVTILPWPIPPSIHPGVVPELRPPRSSRLLFVGSLVPEKGVDVLIDAFRDAWAEQPELALTIVGSASRERAAQVQARAAGLPITFLGALQHSQVLMMYADHDLLVFPSVWDEPFAIVPLEAMAMGLAVIATSAGGTPEAVTHEKTGLLVPPGDRAALKDAILRLARDPSRARTLADAGEAEVRRTHGFSAFMDRVNGLYEEVRRSPRGRS